MPTQKNGWIRIAVIRKGDDPDANMVWRLFIGRRGPAVHARHCDLAGTPLLGKNLLFDEDPSADNALGLRAWIDAYGDLAIVDGLATISLKAP